MNKYYYWIRINPETRSLLITVENPKEFEFREEAIDHGKKIINEIAHAAQSTKTVKLVPLEIDENWEETIYIAPGAQLIINRNQHKLF
jgi:hypothetical protein